MCVRETLLPEIALSPSWYYDNSYEKKSSRTAFSIIQLYITIMFDR